MSRLQIPGMVEIFSKTAAQGGVNWTLFISNILQQSPIAQEGYLRCPRCENEEHFDAAHGPVEFRAYQQEPRFAAWLAKVYQCRRCTHVFAPLVVPQHDAQ